MNFNLKRLKEGDENTFQQIVEAFWVRLYKFASIYTMDKEVAKEIAQDAFLKLWEKRQELSDDSSIITYLLVICRNKCIDYLRQKQLEIVSIDDVNEELFYTQQHAEILQSNVSDILIAKELEIAILKAINKLPDKTRSIFIKSRQQGQMNKEIAEELNISVKTVEFHITKALKLLRDDIPSEFYVMLLIYCSIS